MSHSDRELKHGLTTSTAEMPVELSNPESGDVNGSDAIACGHRRGCGVSVEKFLKQRAVKIAVGGSYTLSNWYDPQGRPRTFACRTSRVSPFRMMVDVPVVGKVGDRLTSYFRDFGKFDGLITETRPGSFLLELEMTASMRENFASKLTWLEKKQKKPAIPDLRKDARIIPQNPHSTLTLADGTTQGCFIIDMSISGAAISTELQPPIGMPLAIGACIARVVRRLPNGFAVKFVEVQNRIDLTRLIVRPPRATMAINPDTKVA
jgi:hypothetical protein